MIRRIHLLLVAVTAGTLVTTACTSRPSATVPLSSRDTEPIAVPPDLLGPQLAGLTVVEEDVKKLESQAGPDSYLASTRMWSLRTGERLRATLQVGRFVTDADSDDKEFQRRVVAQIGRAGARLRVIDGINVYVTVSDEQAIYLWFPARSLLVLSVAGDYVEPRNLLRQALAVAP